MATQRITPSDLDKGSAAKDPLLERAKVFLAERGAMPDKNGVYRERDLIAALRAGGWGVESERRPGRVTVKRVDLSRPSHYDVIESGDLQSALLEALRRSVGWQTADEEQRSFDEQTRSLLGLTGDEFRHRWNAGQLDFDDPTVEHLGVSLPSGR